MKRSSMACPAAGKTRGFSLIELMAAVAIIGILGAIAYPSYSRYMLKSSRTAAQAYLLDLAQAQGRYMADSRSYATTVSALETPTPAAVAAKYTITIDVAEGPPASFTITANPVPGSAQMADGALSIDSAGARTPGALW